MDRDGAAINQKMLKLGGAGWGSGRTVVSPVGARSVDNGINAAAFETLWTVPDLLGHRAGGNRIRYVTI